MKSPLQQFGELFIALNESGIFQDQKAIADAIPKSNAASILASYQQAKTSVDFDLKTFFFKHFEFSIDPEDSFESDRHSPLEDHLKKLWPVLKRLGGQAEPAASSRIALPYDYIVPGGRFNEIYYWDSYFTMLGLKVHKQWDVITSMINNFAWMINQFGFIPNGNRSYFLSRSQPPFFSLMIEMLAEEKGEDVYILYHEALKSEYAFWMKGAKDAEIDAAYQHVVRLDDCILNRYYDNNSSPREEMYQCDLDDWKGSGRDKEEFFLDIKSACESGWDISSRWFEIANDITTIQTSKIIPVDLNCLLWNLENVLSRSYGVLNEEEKAAQLKQNAERRAGVIKDKFWNPTISFFNDLSLNGEHKERSTLAGVYPLSFGLCDEDQAEACALEIERHFLKDGGLISTLIESGQQWDAPNAWAPLQWMTVRGLHNYGFDALASEVARKWTALNEKVFRETGKMMEKYNVVDTNLPAGGGEYEGQSGFGWTNGVYLALKEFLK